MTNPLSPSAPGAGFDSGPLSWVIGEIRETLTRSKDALFNALAQVDDADVRTTLLRQAKAQLHQAHGALQIVDVDGVAILTETIEDLFERVDSGQLSLDESMAEAIAHAYQALVEYLDQLLSGAPHQPVRLFPYYQALLKVRGAERIHPADLFFPNLAIRPKLPPAEAGTDGAVDYVALRKRFEQALLPFLKGGADSAAVAARMHAIVGEVERAQSNQQSRGFWWVMRGFAEAVASGQVGNELYVKQLFARINLQIRRLSEGSSSVAERLLRDALFFIARAERPSARLQQIRDAYQLDGLVPRDYEDKRYGQVDGAALSTARDRLAQAKAVWNRIVGGDGNAAAAFEQEMLGLSDACAGLKTLPLSKLLRELNGIARAAATASPGDRLGVEMATSLLFVENALGQIGNLPENFAERADAMTARLLSIISGDQVSPATPWLDDMSREAQQRQTMMALTGELQSSLRQVEKMLEEYFGNPAARETLPSIQTILHQIGGALAVLDQDDAVRAIAHTQAALRAFAEAEVAPDKEQSQPEFQRIARNIGALSFFIESLQLQADGVRKRFSFDDKAGVFQANIVERASAAPQVIDIDDLPDDDDGGDDDGPDHPSGPAPGPRPTPVASAPDLPTVEQDLLFHQEQSAQLARSLTAEPDNPHLQEQLKQSLQLVRRDATLIDNPEANQRAKAAIDLLDAPDFGGSETALADIVSATAAPQVQLAQVAAVVAPDTDEAIDAELLEIFLGEAVEVLDAVRHTLPAARSDPYNQDHLTTLRRSFHTLKGSGRMVGLMAYGEAAWSIEQVLNLRLSESRGGDADLYALLEMAAQTLGGWVDDLQETGRSDRSPQPLIDAAERVRQGMPLVAPAVPAASVASVEAAPEEPEELQLSDADMRAFDAIDLDLDAVTGGPVAAAATTDVAPTAGHEADAASPADLLAPIDFADTTAADPLQVPDELPDASVPAAQSTAAVFEFPNILAPDTKRDDSVKQIGSLEISLPLHNIYLAETDQLVRLLSHDLDEWRHEPERHVNVLAVHAAHSLAGSSATVGFKPLQEIAYGLESILQLLLRKPVALLESEYDVLEQTLERVRGMLRLFALGEMPDHEPLQVGLLQDLLAALDARAEARLHGEPPAAEHPPIPEDMSPAASPSADLTFAETPVLRLPEAVEDVDVPAAADVATAAAAADVADADAADRAPVPSPAFQAPVIAAALAPAFAAPAAPAERDLLPESTVALKDDLDADLMPVFVEEATDMLPQVGQVLRSWQQSPDDAGAPHALLRLLHTIKGSARMAGAMRLGQHMHELESRIEQVMHAGPPAPYVMDDLLARHDHGLQMFDALQNPQAPAVGPYQAFQTAVSLPSMTSTTSINQGTATTTAPDLHAADAAQVPDAADGMAAVAETADTGRIAERRQPARLVAEVAPAAGTTLPMVRVRADMLDRLVNQAGEVSISRSKLENEVDTMRQSLAELTDNMGRLREQLREVEMQAESQISSQRANLPEREFDPLEFDRFTRLQELTRMMAESVSDVSSVQQNLTRTLDGASADLTTQARLTRDLQQDLMRVRMVQFASISERLYRVTRQASKEVDKRVSLDIRGSAVEIDRSVLEKMAGPFEHLLRNAIVHGIETRAARQAAGKREVGELLVEVRQEGNEVVIQFSDDGQGLNLARIRDKATATGLLGADHVVSDAELTDLIFHPGFSTASEVTELAGRGVGMDVVRAEATALGGRVAIMSEPGKGAQFTVHLPLTLAVTQVVLLTTGGKTFAVPSVLVEQVQQLKTQALAVAYNEGAVTWQSQRVPMAYLATLLGDTGISAVSQQYSPLMILKSGNDRVAIHVDEILGNREVVVKNIGPQLARLTGIAGATVLGSGEIVLILNPVSLAQRAAQENVRAPRLVPSDAPHAMGAVLEMPAAVGTADAGGAARMPQAVAGLRTQKIVMVVDDSLTVRRVTQRLLSREGYQVVLAKDGVDALEQLQSITPDVMLVDIEMPRMDGFDLTRNVRDGDRTRHIPIVMITSRTASKHRNYAFELGVNEYLGKPYQEDMLLGAIRGFIRPQVPVP